MNTCKTCKHYTANVTSHLGDCARWQQGYDWNPQDISENGVVVEGDEGWGAFIGPDFGCVLHEPR